MLAPQGQLPVAIALELDRGTEDQQRWRAKIQALTAWAAGPYPDTFGLDNLTVAVITPSRARAWQLRDWTARELKDTQMQALSDIFLFTDTSSAALAPLEWFFSPLWHGLGSDRPVSLLDEPATLAAQPPAEQPVVVLSPP